MKFKNKQKCAQKFPGNPNILCAYAFVKSNISHDLAKNIVCKLLSGGEVRYLINIIAYMRKVCNSFDDHFCKTLTIIREKARPDLFYY